MGALASIFGALSGLGETGEQLAGAREINRQKALEHLALIQQQQTQKMAQQEQVQRLANERLTNQKTQQQLQTGRTPIMLGNPFTSGGKQYARFQDPISGALSVKEVPGGTPETPEETMYRGLVAIGTPTDQAAAAVIKKLTGKTTLKKETQPDKESQTGFSDVYYDENGTEAWRTEALPSRYLIPTQTTGSSTDPFGLTTTHTSTRRPIIPGVTVPVRPATAGAPPGAVMTVPARVGAPTAQTPQGGQPGPVAAPSGEATGPRMPPGPKGPLNVGTYQGLLPDQTIPPRPGLNPLVQQMANDILQGRDVTKLQPAKARPLAEALARAYGWKGQGSLTPAQQMQIEQVDNALGQMSDPKMLALFDRPGLSLAMAMVPLDPTGEGGFAGLKAGLGRRLVPQEAATYLDTLTRLRGVITGIRGFTGANNSNATADRLLAELPTFTNTKNSADARVKLSRLRQEVSIIKRLGFFLPDSTSPGGGEVLPPPPTGGVNGNNPMGLDLP